MSRRTSLSTQNIWPPNCCGCNRTWKVATKTKGQAALLEGQTNVSHQFSAA
jgi:hypothetical protein